MFNLAILTGWVGRPPKVQDGLGEAAKKLVTSSLATKRKWTDLDGIKHEITTWHTIEAWEDQAWILETVSPGDLIKVVGYIKNEVHEGKFHSAIVAQKLFRLKTKEMGRLKHRENLHQLVRALDDHDRAVLLKLLHEES